MKTVSALLLAACVVSGLTIRMLKRKPDSSTGANTTVAEATPASAEIGDTWEDGIDLAEVSTVAEKDAPTFWWRRASYDSNWCRPHERRATISECHQIAATRFFQLPYIKFENELNSPAGCMYYRRDGCIWYNHHPSGRSQGNSRPICTQSKPEANCPSGFEEKIGDVSGWGQISPKEGGHEVNCDRCAKTCRDIPFCGSFECSASQKRCNLNMVGDPDTFPFEDFVFCKKKLEEPNPSLRELRDAFMGQSMSGHACGTFGPWTGCSCGGNTGTEANCMKDICPEDQFNVQQPKLCPHSPGAPAGGSACGSIGNWGGCAFFEFKGTAFGQTVTDAGGSSLVIG